MIDKVPSSIFDSRAARLNRKLCRDILTFASLALFPAFSAGDEPVIAMLYGPNPGVESMLDELPRARHRELLIYHVPGSTASRKLFVTLSGGLESVDATLILRAIKIELQWKYFEDPWRLSIHGDDRHARVMVADKFSDSTCYSPRTWLLAKIEQEWAVIDGAEWRFVEPPDLQVCNGAQAEIVTPVDGA